MKFFSSYCPNNFYFMLLFFSLSLFLSLYLLFVSKDSQWYNSASDPTYVIPQMFYHTGRECSYQCRRNFYQIVTLQVDFLLLFRVGNTGNIFVPFQTNVSPRFVTRIGDKLWFRNTFFFFFSRIAVQYLKNRENSFVKMKIIN